MLWISMLMYFPEPVVIDAVLNIAITKAPIKKPRAAMIGRNAVALSAAS